MTETGGIGALRVRAAFRLAGHSALYGLAGALGKAVALVTVPILTRLLTPGEYGLADLASGLAAVFVLVACFGGEVPAARLLGRGSEASTGRTVLATYFWTTVAISLLVSAVLLPLAPAITAELWSAPNRLLVGVLGVALIPISAAQASLVTAMRLQARPVAFALMETIDLIGQMLLAVVFAALGGGATGMVAGLVLGSLIGLLAAAYQCRDLIHTKPDLDLSRAMFKEGIAFLPAAIAFMIANYASRAFLVAQVGASAVGLFAVGLRLAGGLALVTSAFSLAWGPYGLALPDSEETGHLFGRVIWAYAWLAVLVALGIGAFSPELITVVSGVPYVDAAQILPGLLISAAMAGGFYLFLVAAGVSGRGKSVATAAIIGSVLQVAATPALLPLLGLQAVGIAAALGQGVALVALLRALGGTVHRGSQAVLLMCLGGAASILLQRLNAAPAVSLVPRLVIAGVCAGLGAVIAIQTLRQITASHR